MTDMPPKKSRKCNSTRASKKKNINVKELQNQKQKGNSSSQRLTKQKSLNHPNSANAITTEGREEEILEPDEFGFSPEYLCECTLQNQNTSAAPEINHGLNQSRSITNTSQKKRPIPRKKSTVIKAEICNYNDKTLDQNFSTTLLCESILQTEDASAHHLPVNDKTNNTFLNNNKLRKRKSEKIKSNDSYNKSAQQIQESALKYIHENKLKYKDISIFPVPNPSNNNYPEKKSLPNLPKKRKLQVDNKAHSNEESVQAQQFNAAFLCESVICSEETSKLELSNEKCIKNTLLKKARNPVTKPNSRIRKIKNYKSTSINNSENRLQIKDISEIPKSNTSKGNCHIQRVTDGNCKIKIAPEHGCKKLDSNVINDQGISSRGSRKSMIIHKEVPVTTETNSTKINLSTHSFIENNHINKNRLHQKIGKKNCSQPPDLTKSNKSKTSLSNLSMVSSGNNVCKLDSVDETKPQPRCKKLRNNKMGNKSTKNGTGDLRETKTSVDTECISESENPKNAKAKSLMRKTNSCYGRKQLKKKKDNKKSKHSRKKLSQYNDLSATSEIDSLKVTIRRTHSTKPKCALVKDSNIQHDSEMPDKETASNNSQDCSFSLCPTSTLGSKDSLLISDCVDLAGCLKTPLTNDETLLQRNVNTNNVEENGIDKFCESTPCPPKPSAISKECNMLEEVCFENKVPESNFTESKEALRHSENIVEKNPQDLSSGEINPSHTVKTSLEVDEEGESSTENDFESNLMSDSERSTDLQELAPGITRLTNDTVSCRNQVDHIIETSFIECNSDVYGTKQSELEVLDDEESEEQTAVKQDPLECATEEICELDFQPKILNSEDSKENVSSKIVKVARVCNNPNFECFPTANSVECDLHLECTLEDTVPLHSDFQDCDSDSEEESHVLGIISPCFDHVITPENFILGNSKLITDSDTFPSLVKGIAEQCKTHLDDTIKLEHSEVKVGSVVLRNEPDFLEVKKSEDYTERLSDNEGFKNEPNLLKVRKLEDTKKLSEEKIEEKDSIKDTDIKYEISDIIQNVLNKIEVSESSLNEIKGSNVGAKEEDTKSMWNNPVLENVNGISSESKLGSGSVLDSKEGLQFCGKPDLKVLLRRLEDEAFFKAWKEEGVISSLIHSDLKLTSGWKQRSPLNLTSKNPSKVRKNWKCQFCRKVFKNRDRYWEHRASKCDKKRVFGCQNCNRKYILKKMLIDHEAKCLLMKLFRCKICSKLFNSQERLDEHNISKCDTQETFHCNVCDRGFIFKRLLLLHKTPTCPSIRLYQCSVCNQSFDKSDFKEHQLKEHGLGLYPAILCEFCGKFVSRKHFSSHMNIHVDAVYPCRVCSEEFRSKGTRRSHEMIHLDIKPCVCADCGKVFRRLNDLKMHVSRGNVSNKCNTCGKIILNQYCFRAHVNSHNKRKLYDGDGFGREIKGELGFKSEIKEELSFNREIKEELSFNREIKEELSFNAQVKEESGFKREIKEESYGDAFFHLINKDQPFRSNEANKLDQNLNNQHQSPSCSEGKTQSKDVILHVPVSHEGPPSTNTTLEEKPFTCEICGNKFSTKQNLKRHHYRIHINHSSFRNDVPAQEKPHACDICGKCFRDMSNLNRHRTILHHAKSDVPTQEKPHACDICGNCFRDKKKLNRHRNFVHRAKSGGTFIPCAFCDEKFTTDALFKAHTFEHLRNCISVSTSVKEVEDHLNQLTNDNNKTEQENLETAIGEKLYTCDTCGKCFGDRFSLERHKKCVHGNNSFGGLIPCTFCDEKFATDTLLKAHTSKHLSNSDSVSTNVREEEGQLNQLMNSCVETKQGKIEIPTEEKSYTCDICGKHFGAKRYLNRHKSRIHFKVVLLNHSPPSNVQINREIGLINDTLDNLKNYSPILNNHEERGDKFASTDIKQEEKIVPVGCSLQHPNEITMDIDDPQQERGIRLDDLGKNGHTAIIEISPYDHTSRLHKCRECGKSFNTEYSRKRHVCLHKLNALQNSVGREVHACKECGILFFEKWRLNRHLLTHSPSTLKCTFCKKCFTSQLKLNVHMLVHGVRTVTEPTFQCSVCKKLFPSSKKLEDHSILHTDQNPYQCIKCNRKFTTSYSLKRHNDNTHADKRFLCSYCNMSFVAFSSLNQHVTYVHKKTVSLTEYVLRIDDDGNDDGDLQDESLLEANQLTVTDIQSGNTSEVNLQPHVFTNICNMFMGSEMFGGGNIPTEKQFEIKYTAVNANQVIPGVSDGSKSLSPSLR